MTRLKHDFELERTALLPLAPGAAMRWALVRQLLPRTAGRILEIGCGRGAFASRLAGLYSDVTSLEPDPVSFAIARQYASHSLRILNHTAEDLPLHETFDLVCAFEVIEHLPDDRAALDQWLRRLRPGGTILLSCPAHHSRFGAWDELVGHYRRYDPEVMHKLLENAGLVDIEIVQYGYPVGPLLEQIRNLIALVRLKRARKTSSSERTASSGRQIQPSGQVGAILAGLVNPPIIALSRLFPDRGVGLVARARRLA